MPIIDITRIKIEQVDKATHKVIPVAEGGEKYIITCNEKAVLTPVYIGAQEHVYSVDNRVVEYNVEDTVIYGINMTITTASFDWKCFKLIHGGSIISEQVQRMNILNGDAINLVFQPVPSSAGVANASTYAEFGITKGYYVHPFNTTVTPPVANLKGTALENVLTVGNVIYILRYQNTDAWKNVEDNYANTPITITSYSTAITNLNPVFLDRNSTVRKSFYFNGFESSYNYISEQDRLAIYEVSHLVNTNTQQKSFMTRRLLGLNMLYTWNETRSGYGRMIYGAHIKRGFFGANAAAANRAYSVPGITYNINYYSNLDCAPTFNFSAPINTADLVPLNTISNALVRGGVFTTIITMHPRPWEIYPLYNNLSSSSYVTNQEFAEYLANDEYILDWYDTLSNLYDPPIDDAGVSQVLGANGGSGSNQDPRSILSRHQYQYTYSDSVDICISAITFVNLAGITGATNILSDIRCINPSVNASYSAAHYGVFTKDACLMPTMTVAGGRNPSNQPYVHFGFSTEEEYLTNIDYFENASDDELDLPEGSYVAPFSGAGNPSDLFKTTLYTKDYLGADINNYVKLQFPMCYSDYPGTTISTQFNNNVFNIYARDDFINRASSFNAQEMTVAEYDAEVAADDAEIESIQD